MDAYEIPSQQIVAHWWRKYELPKLLERANEVRKQQEQTRQILQRAEEEITKLTEENRVWERRIGRWLAKYGRDI